MINIEDNYKSNLATEKQDVFIYVLTIHKHLCSCSYNKIEGKAAHVALSLIHYK